MRPDAENPGGEVMAARKRKSQRSAAAKKGAAMRKAKASAANIGRRLRTAG